MKKKKQLVFIHYAIWNAIQNNKHILNFFKDFKLEMLKTEKMHYIPQKFLTPPSLPF